MNFSKSTVTVALLLLLSQIVHAQTTPQPTMNELQSNLLACWQSEIANNNLNEELIAAACSTQFQQLEQVTGSTQASLIKQKLRKLINDAS